MTSSRGGSVTTEHSAAPWTGRSWLCVLAIVLVCAAVFSGVSRNGILYWDDRYHITENPWFAAINQDSFSHFWAQQYGNLYIPVAYNVLGAEVWLTQQATGDPDIERLNPLLLQLVKVVLHAAVACMVFVLIRRLTRNDWASLAGSLLFALHPLQVESVAWISETRGLLGSVFGLASILALARSMVSQPALTSLVAERSRVLRASAAIGEAATQWSWWFFAAALLAAALLSKPATVTIPLIAAAWLWAIGIPPRRIAIRVVPLLALSAAAVVITRAVQSAAVIPDAPHFWQRPLIAADALCFYLAKLVWPLALAPDYGRTPAHVLSQWGGWWSWLALLLSIAGTVTLTYFARRSRLALAAGAIALLALLPVLGLSTFHHQAISTVADRYAYIALLGPAILLAAWLARTSKPAAWGVAFAALAGCAALSFVQVPRWHTDESLWKYAASVNPSSPVAHNNLGREYQRQGRTADAEPHLVLAAELDPTSASTLINLGELRSAQQRHAEAEGLFRRAIGLAPRDVRGLIGLGIVLAQTGRDAEAAEVLQRALDVDPNQPEAQVNLAVLDMKAGRLDSAAAQLETVLAARPSHPQALYNLALVRAAQSRWKDAADLWGRAMGAGIRTLDIYLRRADAFVRAEMLDEAEHSYLEATSAHPNSYEPWNNLGLVYIRQHRVEFALSAFERAAKIAPDAEEPRDNLIAARKLLEKSK